MTMHNPLCIFVDKLLLAKLMQYFVLVSKFKVIGML